jgi:limonene-1,2-epoxide hydrolase
VPTAGDQAVTTSTARPARILMTQITPPADIVRDYLAAMEARDLDTARAHLAAGFVMHFPGATLRTLEELIAWSTPRYRFVGKTYDAVDAYPSDQGAVVYARGALHGQWPDGAPFSGIRFIDRFELQGGKIVRQDVWNDLAEAAARRDG